MDLLPGAQQSGSYQRLRRMGQFDNPEGKRTSRAPVDPEEAERALSITVSIHNPEFFSEGKGAIALPV